MSATCLSIWSTGTCSSPKRSISWKRRRCATRSSSTRRRKARSDSPGFACSCPMTRARSGSVARMGSSSPTASTRSLSTCAAAAGAPRAAAVACGRVSSRSASSAGSLAETVTGAMLASVGTMADIPSRLTVGLAQIDCRLGDVEGNVERHLAWIERARRQGVALLVFPELSLPGYRLLHLTPRVALAAGSAPIARLAAAAGPMAVVVGFVEEDRQGVLYNSAALLRDGQPAFVHRKLYLPTYGIFQEQRFLGAGRRLELAPLPWGEAGGPCCEDPRHPGPAPPRAPGGAPLPSPPPPPPHATPPP